MANYYSYNTNQVQADINMDNAIKDIQNQLLNIPTDTQLGQKANQTDLDTTNANVAANTSQLADIVYNVKNYGAKGDGTDDTTAIQALLNSVDNGVIYFPIQVPALTASYEISTTLTLKAGHKIKGQNRNVTITQTNDNAFAFTYLSAIQSNGYDITLSLSFEDITISAKNGITLNQSGDYNTVFSKQAAIKGFNMRNVSMKGTYADTTSDTNFGTSVQPTLSELQGYGVGLSFAKVVNALITSCQFENFGIGAYFDGCDVNTFDTNRFNVNARHWHMYNHDTWGSQNKMVRCDILVNCRYGGIYLDGARHITIEDNYFETYKDSATYIVTDNDIGTIIDKNRFDDPGRAIPFMSLNPQYDGVVSNNRYNPSTQTAFVEIKTTHWNNYNAKLVTFRENGQFFPLPDTPFTVIESYDSSIFRYNNAKNLGGNGSTSMPFIKSPVTNRWVLNTTNSTLLLDLKTKRNFNTDFTIRFVGRKNTGGGYVVINYIEDGTSIELFRGSLGFTVTTDSAIIDKPVTITAGKRGNGFLRIELVNTEVEYEEIYLK